MQGQVRSYNKMVEGAGRLMVTLFAQHVAVGAENDTLNRVELSGALCKPPVYRSTPFGREICDLMLAVNRAFGKSDYIPCIAWGRNAQFASRFHVGDRVRVTGRLQSREYQKLLENGEYITRNAFEVSCFTLEAESAGQSSSPLPPKGFGDEFGEHQAETVDSARKQGRQCLHPLASGQQGRHPLAAAGQCPVPPATADLHTTVGRHRLKRPKSSVFRDSPVPASCRSSGPTPTSCRRIEHEIIRHKLDRLISSNSRRLSGSFLSALPGGSRLWKGAALSFPTTKYPEALVYGRRVRAAGASSWQSARPTG